MPLLDTKVISLTINLRKETTNEKWIAEIIEKIRGNYFDFCCSCEHSFSFHARCFRLLIELNFVCFVFKLKFLGQSKNSSRKILLCVRQVHRQIWFDVSSVSGRFRYISGDQVKKREIDEQGVEMLRWFGCDVFSMFRDKRKHNFFSQVEGLAHAVGFSRRHDPPSKNKFDSTPEDWGGSSLLEGVGGR